MRVALAVFAALGAIMLFLLASASANTALFAEHYSWLLAINGVAAVALLVLVALQLRRLHRDFKRGVFGSRLKFRLLLMLSLMAVLPGALVYGVSMQFAVKSIDSWFDVRVDAALEGGLNLGRSVLDTLQTELLAKARDAALDLGDGTFVSPSRLNRLREQTGAQTATLLTLSGQVLGSSSGELRSLVPSVPAPSQLRAARSGRGLALIGEAEGGGLMLRALAPVSSSSLNLDPWILQLTLAVPASIAKSAGSVEAAHRDYQELQLGRTGLKRIYTLTLTLALLLALFAAIALAFFLAERLARPLLILAEGTQAVASGDYAPRATVEASDELGVLTHSFNSMTHQLSEARAQAEHHRQEMEAAQAYLESVLANLSAGVLAFDLRFRLRASNRGALAILGDDLSGFEQTRLQDWPRHETLAGAILGGFAQRGDEWQEQLEIARPDGMSQALLVRGTALPAAGGGGYVVVFDDITRLIAAQRSAAWGEVAQRLAHEIKNPLTPIQLSAERLQLKLADQLTGASRELLDRATQTIVNQVEAMKNMVNDFRDYARTPLPELDAVDLQGLLGEVLGLYENSTAAIAVTPALTPVPPVLADANQLRQVLHNVLTNAQDALADTADAQITIVATQEGSRARLTVADNGPGFPAQILSRAFEPYVTTKSKGTGLGLAIVKKIVDDHGGEIRLANNHGGEVSIWLPLATPDAVKGV
ncbi:MAG: signal transduction histidine kinase involved in nitrogen fixation and metabolism regulation [Rhodocyclaceae bacterium]|nr:MAG: signal transduction histidine kinase involved in nitrogen fixation and metabolism regulation [Rhodocyclaceae bacterium]TND04565.1 MAG: signal transduction histidine kinase involved in nitrogen fixation and metabolism regulation [Rhodocyclaceae bacterium]